MTSISEKMRRDGLKIADVHRAVMRPNWLGRSRVMAVSALLLGLFVLGFATLDVTWVRMFTGFGELGKIATLMIPPTYGSTGQLLIWCKALIETLAIAFLGTCLAALLAFPFGFLAARNVMPLWIFRFSLRRGFDAIRGVDTLIWALIWINVVGLGPFAGVLAIMSADIGAFGKLFSEAIEAVDEKTVEGVQSTGGTALHAVRFGLMPQVMPVILSQILYYIESNTRSATIIGIVGAGGIGLHLSEQIRTLEWQHVLFIVAMILVTVAIIDAISSRIRFAIIGKSGYAVSRS